MVAEKQIMAARMDEVAMATVCDDPQILEDLCLLRNFILVDLCCASKRRACRIVAIFPQVDDLRFINLWEA